MTSLPSAWRTTAAIFGLVPDTSIVRTEEKEVSSDPSALRRAKPHLTTPPIINFEVPVITSLPSGKRIIDLTTPKLKTSSGNVVSSDPLALRRAKFFRCTPPTVEKDPPI